MDKKVYRVSPLTWIISVPFILLAAFFVFSVIIVTPSILTIENPFFMLFVFLVIIFLTFFVVYAALIFFDIPTAHLELSDDGLIFYSNGYRIYTPWENIAEVGWLPRYRSFPSLIRFKEPAVVGEISFEEGIASRRAVSEKRRWWMLNRQLKAGAQYTKYIRIPVALLRRKDKQEGSISQYLQYYMPCMIDIRR
jgi:hypothetical protein